ncbi:hypothetical protein LLE49_25160 [Alicyclobacillus tolerans]|uniref:hypothetical protein n=1 Tax=Alicyclobacillus tolerans TaxID=90970 RepID=UPI001F1E2574|nr:hypothetical protein [Alicyclobacillus tolerans]MCF8568018.1 hypothetical protein [Alicyclobacillus tolerans]
MDNEEVKRVYKTITYNDIVFEHYPVYLYGDDPTEYFLIRDQRLIEQISREVPQTYKSAIRVDCAKIPDFAKELKEEPPTEAESRILNWLENL